jgi:hypothetical protein
MQDTIMEQQEKNFDELSKTIQKCLNILENNAELEDNIGVTLPRIHKNNPRAKELAIKLFPFIIEVDNSDIEKYQNEYKKQKIWAYIKYAQLLAKLTKGYETYKLRIENEEKQKLKEKKECKICTVNKEIFKKLYERNPLEPITIPTAMPVEIAQIEELEPFFDYMKQNTKVEIENEEEFNRFIKGSNNAKFREFKRGAYYTDGRIDLCKQVVGPPHIYSLMESIRYNPNIEHFLLGNNIIGDIGSHYIAEFIKNEHTPKIKTWYIAGNAITDKGVSEIADALKSDKHADALWLKRNPLTSDGIKHIAEMLKINNTLEILDLHNTFMQDDGVKYLFEALRENTKLHSLYIDANHITKDGAKYISDYFEYLANTNRTGIVYLWLSMNRIEDDGIISIANALKKYDKMIGLCVSSNRITHVGAKVLFESLENSKTLVWLDCGYYKATHDMGELPNIFGNESTPYIKKFLEKNQTIQYFSIYNNTIDLEYLHDIVESMKKNNSLCLIIYGQNHLRTSTDKQLNKKIKEIVDSNSQRLYGVDSEEFRRKFCRKLKHTEKIYNIDSIYRNAM